MSKEDSEDYVENNYVGKPPPPKTSIAPFVKENADPSPTSALSYAK